MAQKDWGMRYENIISHFLLEKVYTIYLWSLVIDFCDILYYKFKSFVQPVTESTALSGNLLAVNNLDFSGNIGHILVKRHEKTKKALALGELPPDRLPRLVLLQTRNEEGAQKLIEKVSSYITIPCLFFGGQGGSLNSGCCLPAFTICIILFILQLLCVCFIPSYLLYYFLNPYKSTFFCIFFYNE